MSGFYTKSAIHYLLRRPRCCAVLYVRLMFFLKKCVNCVKIGNCKENWRKFKITNFAYDYYDILNIIKFVKLFYLVLFVQSQKLVLAIFHLYLLEPGFRGKKLDRKKAVGKTGVFQDDFHGKNRWFFARIKHSKYNKELILKFEIK